jgi:hypothetical protein
VKSKLLTALTVSLALWFQVVAGQEAQLASDTSLSLRVVPNAGSSGSARQPYPLRIGAHGIDRQVAGLEASVTELPTQLADSGRSNLSCPSRFDEDGIYIWCDPDGVWTIFWFGRSPYELVARCSSNTPIIVKESAGSDTQVLQAAAEVIEIRGESRPQSGVARFSCQSGEMAFDILINGTPSTSNVHIGSQMYSPVSSTFSLRTQCDIIPELSRGANQITPIASPTLPSGTDYKVPLLQSVRRGAGGQSGSAKDSTEKVGGQHE